MTLLSTPPLSPNVIKELNAIGIKTHSDLQRLGSAQAFLLLKEQGLTITFSTLWALEAVLGNMSPNSLSSIQKKALRTALKTHPPVAVFPEQNTLKKFMRLALLQAQEAKRQQEVPVGAVIVFNDSIIGWGFNQCISQQNISKHAELIAIEQASRHQKNYRLEGCDIYVTLEPCPMCASAIIQSRIRRVIFGTIEPKMGAAGSLLNLFANIKHNTHTAIIGGILAKESQQLLQQFFQKKR